MATPVKETPILTGKDARRFEEAMANPRPVSRDEAERIMAAFEKTEVVDSPLRRVVSTFANDRGRHMRLSCGHEYTRPDGCLPSWMECRECAVARKKEDERCWKLATQ